MAKVSTLVYVLEHLDAEASTLFSPQDIFMTPDTDLSEISRILDCIEYEPGPAVVERLIRMSGTEG